MRRALALFVLITSLLVSTWVSELLAAKVSLDPKFVYYSVTGSSVAELRASIARNGPKQGTAPRDSKTETEFFYNTKFTVVGGVCRFSNVRIRVVTVYTLPKWINRDEASAELKARWDAYAQSLRQHQDGHAADANWGRQSKSTALRAAAREHLLRLLR
jgi:predicted secreted Zn-dependent protease